MSTIQLALDLARASLPDFAPEPLVADLAQHIRDSIECWIQNAGDLSECPRCVGSEARFAEEDQA